MKPHARLKGMLLISIMFSSPAMVLADQDQMMPAKLLPSYQQECASCHLAYPPAFLPAASWKRLMGNLEQHFGSDASIDSRTAIEITGWLTDHAGTYKRVKEVPQDNRITSTAWFVRKHRKVEDAVWLRESIKSKANCAACHTQAERGNYDDDHVVVPK